MTDRVPPMHDPIWGAFAPTELVPADGQPIIEKLGQLRTRAMDLREAEQTARNRISEVEAGEIAKAVDKLAAGESTAVDSKPVDKAKTDHAQTIRDIHAVEGALTRVERELAVAYIANSGEAKARVDETIERTRADYADAVDKLTQARKAHLDAVAAKQFTKAAIMPLADMGRRGGRPPMVNYNGRPIDQRDYQQFRDEISPPMLVLSTPASGAGLAGNLDRVDVPSDGW